ncbi:MAG: glycosyltransferase family 4 protein [Chthoniobacterales bacterium]
MPALRILCLNYEYPPIGGGGGRASASICEALAARGHQVEVQTTGMAHLPRIDESGGVRITRNFAFRRREDTCSVGEMAAYLVCSLIPAIRHTLQWRPDVIHAHFAVPTGALAWAVSTITRTPYVLTAHLGDVPGGVPEQTDRLFKWVGPFTKPIWSGAAGVTAVSGFVAKLAENAYHRRAVVIPNGITLDPRPTLAIHTTPRIVMVGRLSIQKNPLLAIHALAKISQQQWHLDIIGDGPLRRDVEAAILASGLSERITLHGWLNTAEVHQQMRQADVLLMPSLSEGMPVAAVEALNHGLAIVSGQIDGMRDVLEDGVNGLMLELSPAAFAAGLTSLILDPERLLKMRNASAEKALSFDIIKTAASYEAVLIQAAGAATTSPSLTS